MTPPTQDELHDDADMLAQSMGAAERDYAGPAVTARYLVQSTRLGAVCVRLASRLHRARGHRGVWQACVGCTDTRKAILEAVKGTQ